MRGAAKDLVNLANCPGAVSVAADTFETANASTVAGGTGTDTLAVSLDKDDVNIILTGGVGGGATSALRSCCHA